MSGSLRRLTALFVCGGLCFSLAWGCTARPELPALVEQGWTAYQAHDRDALQAVMTQAIQRDERAVESRFLRGLFLIRAGSPDAALIPLRETVRTKALQYRSMAAAAQAYYDLGQFHAVEQVLNDLLQQQPDNIDAHRLLAALNYDLGVNPRAIDHLEAVAKLDPLDPRPHRLIGLMRKDFQDYPAAVEAYREALTRNPQPVLATEIRLELAQALAEQREYAQALETLTSTDQSPEALAVRLQCLDALDRRAEAAPIVAAARALPDIPAVLWLALGDYSSSGGDQGAAIHAYEEAARVDPLDFIPRYKLSSAYARAGRKADAERELATMEANRARYDRLHELQNQAMERTDDADLRFRIGEAAAALGRSELAQAWYRAALGLDPTHAAAQNALAATSAPSQSGTSEKTLGEQPVNQSVRP